MTNQIALLTDRIQRTSNRVQELRETLESIYTGKRTVSDIKLSALEAMQQHLITRNNILVDQLIELS